MSYDKRKKKRRGRNKLNLSSCFRSSFTPDDYDYKNYSDARNYDSKNGRLGKPVMIAVSSKKKLVPDVNNLVNGDSYSKLSPPRRRISRLVKAVLFNSLMVKKIANSSSKSPDQTSESNLLDQKIDKSNDDNIASGLDQCTDTDDSSSRHGSNLHSLSSSRTTSSSYSSSSSSSSNSNSRSSSDQKASRIDLLEFRHPVTFNSRAFLDQKVSSRTDQPYRRQDSTVSLPLGKPKPINSNRHSLSFEKGLSRLDSVDSKNSVLSHPAKVKSNGNNYWNIRWCLFICLSLIVLMVYGRIYSILCTSTWFYFVPCRKIKRVNSVNNAVKLFDTDSEQYKKRVIMAGLLDRTRNPLG